MKKIKVAVAITAFLLAMTTVVFADELSEQSTAPPQLGAPVFLDPPNKDGPTVVRTAFHLRDIQEVNDEEETFHFIGVLSLKWKDSRQAFDPKKEGVQEKIYQGDYQFNELSPAWYPQIVLVNESGMYESGGVILRVKPDGSSTLVQTVEAIAEVNFKMRWFPFDVQRLGAAFEVLGYDSSEVVFEVDPSQASSTWEELEVSQWHLVNVRSILADHLAPYAGARGYSSTFTAEVEIHRKSFFVIRLVVVPLVLIVMLSWSVFWMERASLGDRINISFVGILTAVAYKIVVVDLLTHVSYVTWMNGFMNVSFFIMCATVIENLVVGEYDKRGKTDVGDRIDYCSRWLFPLAYIGLLLSIGVIIFLFLGD